MTTDMTREQMIEALRWQLEAGADEAVLDAPVNRFAEAVPPVPEPVPAASGEGMPRTTPGAAHLTKGGATAAPNAAKPTVAASREGVLRSTGKSAHELAAGATTIEELRAALLTYDGCALSRTATNLVFCDGNPAARIVLVGEAPGAEEDRQGLPFVGPAGKLLDRMLAAIGLDRGSVLVTNTIYWRPPGNRNPAPEEVAACLPFVERVIEIADPAVLVLVGGIAAKTLLGTNDGIMKLRGKWTSFETPRMSRPVPTMPIFHPAFLLRSPGQKRLAWHDLIEIKRRLEAENSQNNQ